MFDQRYIIGISGGSGSGKTTLIKRLRQHFTEDQLCVLSQDNYYKPRSEQPLDSAGLENFDVPESIDIPGFVKDVLQLKQGHALHISEYTFNNPAIVPQQLIIKSAPVILVEGLFLFSEPSVESLLQLKVFVEVNDFLRLKRRIYRDQLERGYDLQDVLYRSEFHVEPAYKKYIEPYKAEADLILPNHTGSNKAFQVLIDHIESYLRKSAFNS